MNIFYLDKNPVIAAQYHNNKHVVKMILETKTLLETAHGKQAWKNHPCAVWVRASVNNYRWLAQLGLALCAEYTYRYGKVHKSQDSLMELSKNEPELDDVPFMKPYLAMPEDCHCDDAVISYKKYYIWHKRHLAQWKVREQPKWWL